MLTDLERQADKEAEEARQAFIGVKDWYTSKTIWGAILTLFSIAGGAFGIALAPEDLETLSTALSGIGAGIGAILSVYGRVKANKALR